MKIRDLFQISILIIIFTISCRAFVSGNGSMTLKNNFLGKWRIDYSENKKIRVGGVVNPKLHFMSDSIGVYQNTINECFTFKYKYDSNKVTISFVLPQENAHLPGSRDSVFLYKFENNYENIVLITYDYIHDSTFYHLSKVK